MTSLEQKKQIKELLDLGKKCPAIATELGLKVRTVRKWVSRLKKGVRYIPQWVVQKEAQ